MLLVWENVGDLPWRIPPLGLPVLLFAVFTTLLVHICQRLVERTTIMIGPEERRSAFARTSICIACLVWTLDVAGLFMFQDLQPQNAKLSWACLSLMLMVASFRWTIPPLSNTLSSRRIILAAVGLATGITVAHASLMASLGEWTREVRWSAALGAVIITSIVAGGLATLHRSAQLRAVRSSFRTLPWSTKVLAGMLILPLHIFLVNTFPIRAFSPPSSPSGIPLLIVLVLFGVALSLDHMFKMQAEEKQQQFTNRALALVRRVDPDAGDTNSNLLALIAERLEILATSGSLRLHFQPIVPTGGSRHGIRLEALLRAQDETLGAIHPEQFFLACERTGRTGWVDRILLSQALAQSTSWLMPTGKCCGISVNISPDTVLEEGFVPWLEEKLTPGVWPAGWLQLEITEHALISRSSHLAQILAQVRALGVRIAMDDFGAGFSSLTVLAALPIDTIKCDRAFLKDIEKDAARRVLLKYVCEMGQGLGLSVTVEGVETQAQRDIILDKGASCIQGYLVARPMPAEQIATWLSAMESRSLGADLPRVSSRAPA